MPGERARRAVRRAGWWGLDYAYAGARQVQGLRRLDPDALSAPQRSLRGGRGVPHAPDALGAVGALGASGAPVVLVPGVYESWTFLRPLGLALRAAGHPVHVLPGLGHNRGPVTGGAAALGAYVADRGLAGVVVVAHSKGGLIGKLAMLREDPEGRLRALVAIATPFAGSSLARWVPLPAVRAFRPVDATLLILAAERAVNARIVSVYGPFDPHIPAGSRLAGAMANVELATPGHFRVLADPRLPEVVRDAVARLECP